MKKWLHALEFFFTLHDVMGRKTKLIEGKTGFEQSKLKTVTENQQRDFIRSFY